MGDSGGGAEQGGGHRGQQDGGHDGERPGDGEFAPEGVVQPHHFEADEDEDGGEAVLEEREALDGAGEQEVERTQAEDGEDVRGEDEQRFAGQGEDGGDGVDGEDDVADFDEEQGE